MTTVGAVTAGPLPAAAVLSANGLGEARDDLGDIGVRGGHQQRRCR